MKHQRPVQVALGLSLFFYYSVHADLARPQSESQSEKEANFLKFVTELQGLNLLDQDYDSSGSKIPWMKRDAVEAQILSPPLSKDWSPIAEKWGKQFPWSWKPPKDALLGFKNTNPRESFKAQIIQGPFMKSQGRPIKLRAPGYNNFFDKREIGDFGFDGATEKFLQPIIQDNKINYDALKLKKALKRAKKYKNYEKIKKFLVNGDNFARINEVF